MAFLPTLSMPTVQAQLAGADRCRPTVVVRVLRQRRVRPRTCSRCERGVGTFAPSFVATSSLRADCLVAARTSAVPTLGSFLCRLQSQTVLSQQLINPLSTTTFPTHPYTGPSLPLPAPLGSQVGHGRPAILRRAPRSSGKS